MIPAELAWLFWDIDPGAIDLVRHRDYATERIMTHGDWRAMRWLVEHVDESELAAFLWKRGHVLTPRDRAFWSVVAGVPSTVAPGGRLPDLGRMMASDVITGDQRSALAKLAPLLHDGFYLVGGVAITVRFRTEPRAISTCSRHGILTAPIRPRSSTWCDDRRPCPRHDRGDRCRGQTG